MTKFILNSLLCIFLCCSFQCLYAQEWAWSRAIYPNHAINFSGFGTFSALDVNDNLLVAFNTKDSTRTATQMFKHPKNAVIALCKYNEKGDLLWLKEKICSTLNNEGNISLEGMKTDSKGNIYMIGSVFAAKSIYLGAALITLTTQLVPIYEYSFIAKFNAEGEYLSSQIFKNCELSHIVVDKADNLLFLGLNRTNLRYPEPRPLLINQVEYPITMKDKHGIFVGKFNSIGTLLGVQSLISTNTPLEATSSFVASSFSIEVDNENNIIFMGDFHREIFLLGEKYTAKALSETSLTRRDIIVAKMKPNFEKIWVKQIASNFNDLFSALFVDPQNNIYWTAYSHEQNNMSEDKMKINNETIGNDYVAKLNPNGKLEWVKLIEDGIIIKQISQIKTGKILFAGTIPQYVKNPRFGKIPVSYLELPLPTGVNLSSNNYFVAQLATDGEYEWVRNWASAGGFIRIHISPTTQGDIYVKNDFGRRCLLENTLFVAKDAEPANFLLSKIELCPQNLNIQKIDEPPCNTVTLQSSSCKDCTYEWLYDNKIVGTNATYTATKAGNYQLVAKKQFCTVTANTTVDFPVLDVQFTVRQEVAKTDSIVVFPNPTTELVQMKFLALPPIALQTQSATKWTTIRWYYQGELLPQWNNQTTIYPSLAGVYEFVGTDEKGCVLRKNAPEIPRNEELKVEFALYDGMGRTLMESTTNYLDLNQTLSVNMKTYQAGMYLLVAKTNKGVRKCYKIVKL